MGNNTGSVRQRGTQPEAMSKVTDGETKTILKKLAVLLLIFYAIQFIVCLSMAAGMGIMSKENREGLKSSHKYNAGLLPFWHFNCGVGQGGHNFVRALYPDVRRDAGLPCELGVVGHAHRLHGRGLSDLGAHVLLPARPAGHRKDLTPALSFPLFPPAWAVG